VARVEVPRRPPFPYRYIGRFGPETNPIAAFSRDGEVITVRAGDRIGPDFVVRAIGIETVEVEASIGGERPEEPVALGAAG
jgi:hypothetical protein